MSAFGKRSQPPVCPTYRRKQQVRFRLHFGHKQGRLSFWKADMIDQVRTSVL